MISSPLSGQNLDSLKNILSGEKSFEKKIDLLKAIGEGQINSDPKGAIRQFEELILIAEQQQMRTLKVYALNRIGNCWLNQDDLKQSIQFYFQALESTEDGPEFNDIKSRVYNNLGWSFKRLEEYEKALTYFQQAEGYARQVGNKNVVGLILNNKGVTQKDLKQYDQALISLNESLNLNRAIGNKKQELFNLNNISVIYFEQRRYNEAIERFEQLLALNTEIRDTTEMINNLQNLGNAYLEKADFPRAENYYLQALEYTKRGNKEEMKSKLLGRLSTTYQKQGKYREGLEFFRKYYQLSDSLKIQETKRYALELDTRFSSLMKERELEKARKELVEQRLYLTWIVGALILAIFIVIFFLGVIILKRRNERKLVNLNKEIEGQAEELSTAIDSLNQLNKSLEEKNIELEDTLVQLRKAQEQLIQAEKMASLGILSSGIAHELNNPLNFIKGGVTALEEEFAHQELVGTDGADTYIKIIHEGVNRASAILKGLGNYSRQSERMDEPCDLHKVVENCLMILQYSLKDHVTIEKKFCTKAFQISGNEGKLHQAFLNIIQNAEQAIGENGTIRITTTVTDRAMTISIADTGCGIPQEHLKRLGDPFFTTKAPGKGTGLGLSIAYKIIQDHGGRIVVQSEVGRGTEFFVNFE